MKSAINRIIVLVAEPEQIRRQMVSRFLAMIEEQEDLRRSFSLVKIVTTDVDAAEGDPGRFDLIRDKIHFERNIIGLCACCRPRYPHYFGLRDADLNLGLGDGHVLIVADPEDVRMLLDSGYRGDRLVIIGITLDDEVRKERMRPGTDKLGLYGRDYHTTTFIDQLEKSVRIVVKDEDSDPLALLFLMIQSLGLLEHLGEDYVRTVAVPRIQDPDARG